MVKEICYAIVYIAEAFIAWLYFEYLFARKTDIGGIAISFVLGHVVLFAISMLNSVAANVIGCFVANLLLAYLNYNCAIKTAILHSAFLCFIMSIAEILMDLLIGSFGYGFTAYTYNISILIGMAVTSKLLYLVLSIIASRLFKPHKHTNEEPRMMILFCSLPLFSAVTAILIIYLGLKEEMTAATELILTLNLLALLTFNLIFMVLYNYLQKVNAEHLTLQLSLQREQADAAYYQAMQEQFENQRILVHDIKNHLQTIGTLAKKNGNGEIESYVSRLEATIAPSAQAKLCGDPILNMILLRFRDDCQAQNIDFQCDVRENTSTFMDAPSITTLYSNLLSNAIEAAGDSAERLVTLSVKRISEQSVIVILVVNSCDTVPVSDYNGHFRTRKPDRELHGVGLKSIDRIVKKYNGISTMRYDKETKRFHHIIQFPQ